MSKSHKNNKDKSGRSLKPLKPCHAVTEVYDNFYLCAKYQVYQAVDKYGADVLIPLASLNGDIWEIGFTGKISYYPIMDFDSLPTDILDRLVTEILNYLKDGLRVCLFCLGGHGRTGYIAACVLGKLGVEDPVKWVRELYCEKAIESNAQIQSISKYLKKPELYSKYKMSEKYLGYGYDWYGFSDCANPKSLDSKNSHVGFNWGEYFKDSLPSAGFVPDTDDIY